MLLCHFLEFLCHFMPYIPRFVCLFYAIILKIYHFWPHGISIGIVSTWDPHPPPWWGPKRKKIAFEVPYFAGKALPESKFPTNALYLCFWLKSRPSTVNMKLISVFYKSDIGIFNHCFHHWVSKRLWTWRIHDSYPLTYNEFVPD